ncbi:MAG: hypothetical protein Kow0089_21450 [Desulfobulbaceae bacterium]
MRILERIPISLLAAAALLVGLAPFAPEPHAVEKMRMLLEGELRRPIDIFDLFFHLLPAILLILRLAGGKGKKTRQD